MIVQVRQDGGEEGERQRSNWLGSAYWVRIWCTPAGVGIVVYRGRASHDSRALGPTYASHGFTADKMPIPRPELEAVMRNYDSKLVNGLGSHLIPMTATANWSPDVTGPTDRSSTMGCVWLLILVSNACSVFSIIPLSPLMGELGG